MWPKWMRRNKYIILNSIRFWRDRRNCRWILTQHYISIQFRKYPRILPSTLISSILICFKLWLLLILVICTCLIIYVILSIYYTIIYILERVFDMMHIKYCFVTYFYNFLFLHKIWMFKLLFRILFKT